MAMTATNVSKPGLSSTCLMVMFTVISVSACSASATTSLMGVAPLPLTFQVMSWVWPMSVVPAYHR